MKTSHTSTKKGIDFARWFHNEYTAWLVLALSAGITLFGWSVSKEYIEKRAVESFQFEVEDAGQRILFRIANYEQALRGGVALFNSSTEVNRSEWKTYVETLNLDKTLPGIQGFGYAKMILPENLERHESQVRAQGYPNYSVRPDGERDLYSSIVYLEPFDFRNRRAFGFDMYSEQTRRAAMNKALETGSTAVSGLVKLVQETSTDIQAGFLIYLPVYKKGMATESVAQRRRAIQGFVYSPFRAKDLMLGVLGGQAIPLTFQIYDGDKADPEALLYDSRRTIGLLPENQQSEPQFTGESKLDLPGRTWTVEFQSTPIFEQSISSVQPQLILVAGGVIDLLLFLVISSLAAQRKILSKQNLEMEAARSRYSSLVDGLQGQYAFFTLDAQGALVYQSPSFKTFLALDEVTEGEILFNRVSAFPDLKPMTDALRDVQRTFKPSSFRLDLSGRKNSKLVSATGWVSASIDAHGKLLSFEGVIQDDTARSLSERQLANYRDNLEALVKERTRKLEEAHLRLTANDRRLRTLVELSKSTSDYSKDQFIERVLQSTDYLFSAERAFLIDYRDSGNQLLVYQWDADLTLFQCDELQDLAVIDGSGLLKEAHQEKAILRKNEPVSSLLTQVGPSFVSVNNCLICSSREDAGRTLILGLADKNGSFDQDEEQQALLFLEDLARLLLKTEVSEALKQAKSSAEAASLAKRLFLANMSHEIRTPLNAIMGLNTLLRDQPLNEECQGMLNQIDSSSKHLLSILEDVLDFSRIDSGTVQLEYIEFDPRQLVADSLKLVQGSSLSKGLSLKVEIAKEVPQRLIGDPTRLQQILTNFLSNAIKFSAQGEIVTEVSLVSTHDCFVRLKFSVTDQGIGFDTDRLQTILQPFEQADNTHARQFGGTGLGLAIVKKLLDMMDGELLVQSQPGEGSTFSAVLGFEEVETAQQDTLMEAMAKTPEQWKERFNGFHVLVVEDNLLNRQVAKALLERVGFNVSLAEDGVLGVHAIREDESIDLILMDIHMPNMDGLTATSTIRADESERLRQITILGLSACATEEDQERPVQAGMNGYVVKPIDAKVLYASLDLYLPQAKEVSGD